MRWNQICNSGSVPILILAVLVSFQGAQAASAGTDGKNLACNFCVNLNSDLFEDCLPIPMNTDQYFGTFLQNLTGRWPEFQQGNYLHLVKSFMVWQHKGMDVNECTKINVQFELDSQVQTLTTWGGVSRGSKSSMHGFREVDDSCKVAPPQYFSQYWYSGPYSSKSAVLSGFEMCTCKEALCNSADSSFNMKLPILLVSLFVSGAWSQF